MESKSKADKEMAVIRNFKYLRGLKLRHRNKDGSLDIRCAENKGFAKGQEVSDYYNPYNPKVDVPDYIIKRMMEYQQKAYDDARFEQLNQRIKELEKQRRVLLELRAADKLAFKAYQEALYNNKAKHQQGPSRE